jgi:hypothetical protein
MGKVLLIAILVVGSSASAGALGFQEIAPSVGGRRIVVLARDDGRYANSPLKSWFDRLASGNGLCCSFADGFQGRRRRLGHAGRPLSRAAQRRMDRRADAVVTEANKFGPAVVWPYMGTDGQTQIRCFLPGADT